LADADSGLKILNISDPSSPTKLHTVPKTSSVIDLQIHREFLFLGCHGNGVIILDVANPILPVRLGSFSKSAGEAYGVAGNRTHLYVADLQLGVYLLNITDPTHPVEIKQNGNTHPHDISFDGEFIYLADQDRKIIIFSSELTMLFSGSNVNGFQIPVLIAGVMILVIFTKKTKR
ncbi:MAG: LVIVD repeat-containing protein, partial [Candidatus Hodarchaeales archaeon]